MLSKVYGQESIKNKLISFLNSKIPNVLLFVGPSGVGKLTSAINFIDEVYGGKYNLNNHPDIKIFIPDKKIFKLEAVTQLLRQASLSPLELSHNYFILKDVQLMNTEASNAILKVLEENQNHNRFILIAEDIQRILPTILSRSIILEFGTVALSKFFPEITSFEEKISFGSIGKYLLIKDLDIVAKYQYILDFIKKYPSLSYAEILEWWVDLEKIDYKILSDLFLVSSNELLMTLSGDINYLADLNASMLLYQEKIKYSVNEEMHFEHALIFPKLNLKQS